MELGKGGEDDVGKGGGNLLTGLYGFLVASGFQELLKCSDEPRRHDDGEANAHEMLYDESDHSNGEEDYYPTDGASAPDLVPKGDTCGGFSNLGEGEARYCEE